MSTPKDKMQGLQLPAMPTQQQGQEPVYYLEAANGLTVRVPQSRLEAWQAEQDKLRKGSKALTSKEQQLIDAIVSDLYGSQK